jgi:hypothetical protein
MRRVRSPCCARAAIGHAAAAAPSSVMSLRQSFDHLVGAGEQHRRNVEIDCLRSSEIDHQIELRRHLDRKVVRVAVRRRAILMVPGGQGPSQAR